MNRKHVMDRKQTRVGQTLALLGILLLSSVSQELCAQSSQTFDGQTFDGLIVDGERIISAEGSGKEVDKQHRGPNLTVGVQAQQNAAKILVAGKVLNKDYEHFPIRYQFFINRQLFRTQVSSPELPGPIGVDIGSDIATVPFNYTIVAEVLHPNRRFTTVVQGAVTQADVIVAPTTQVVTSLVDQCTLTLNLGEDNETTYSASQVTFKRSGTDVTAVFLASNSDSSESAAPGSNATDVQIRLSLEETDSSQNTQLERDVDGTLIYVTDDTVTSISVEGSFTLGNNEQASTGGGPLADYDLAELSLLSSDDAAIELDCGSAQSQAIKALASEIAN